MSLYQDETAVRTHAAEIAGKAAKRKSRKIWALAAVGTLVAGSGAAFAAVLLQSNEASANLEKGQAAELVLDNAQFTGPLWPGLSTGLKFRVQNNNPFAATIKTIQISGTSTTTCDAAKLTGPAADVGAVNGMTLTLTTPVEVAGNADKWIEYPKVVTLDKSAQDSCAIAAKFKVSGDGAFK
jgi:hypothetical protein